MERSEARVAVQACLEQERRAAEGNLDRMSALVAADLAGLQDTSTGTAALAAFVADTAAFEAYRVRHCHFLGVQAMPGTGAGDIERACLADLAATRADELAASLGTSSADADWQAVSGKEWRLTGLRVEEPLDGTAPTLSFGDDLRVFGNGTSNRFMSSYLRRGYGLAIGPVAATLMFLDDPPGAMQQEQEYLGLLQHVDSFALTDGEFLLMSRGKAILTFE